ncbi:hypothetical protein H8S23_03130 [Anaerofilum sp. BX8]|uniref:Uncharacterized protein n=1 Tax=Anaerofilum hominis TaxID=2763016 RepID=A0A923KV77_9FIRM|nr:hypothetical protein [Anaerofilum hominis]MBC5580491.1 hypothetical protein [Anaerofilum hominis]
MRDSLLRNLRCQGHTALLSAGGVLITVLALCLFSALTAPVDAIAQTVGQNFVVYIPVSCMLWSMGISLNFYAVCAPNYLSLGSTRGGIFVVQQLIKVLFCGLGCAVMFGSLKLFGGPQEALGGTALLAFGSLLLLDGAGELAGLLAYRYGKWAMLLYGLVIFVICLFAGGVFGIFAASSQVEDNLAARLLQWAAGLPAAGIAGLAVAGSAVLAAVTWIFFRRTAVKS